MNKSLIVALAAAMILGACGTNGVTPIANGPGVSAELDALATRTLLTGFREIHMAVFSKMDANEDKMLDEYEAGSGMDLKDFAKADRNRNGKVSRKEFMDFATGGSLFGFLKQDKNDFMKQSREALLRAFKKLDRNADRMVNAAEMKSDALTKVGVNLRIDGLHVRVVITELDDAIFESSDKTGDAALTQAEFEDYCMTSFIKLINPKYTPTPAPGPNPDPQESPASDDSESW